MYPQGFVTTVEVSELDRHLCGPSRPGHFRGVCTVVLKLLNIVQPDVAIFGEKDAQQARIIRRMVRDLDVPTEILFGPTVREADGLALSSRNRYLTAAERALAPRIYATLCTVRDAAHAGERDVARLEALFRSMLAEIPGSRVDYASIVDEETLQPIALLDRPALAATAVFLGSTRLIDNIVITMPTE
jgi:pantoate--beta-alanine ligase